MSTRPGSASALLVIDMQVGVMLDCVDAGDTLARALRAVERARAAAVAVIWVQDEQDFARPDPDWQLAPPLEPLPGETLIHKAYRDAFAGTALTEVLDAGGVSRLILAGAQSDFCVRTAGQSAAARGYDVTLIADAHTTRAADLGGAVVSGAAIVAHTNRYFAGLRYPGQEFSVATHDRVPM